MENSKRLGRQVRPGPEPRTSCLLVLSATIQPLVGPENKDIDSSLNDVVKSKSTSISSIAIIYFLH